jgi:hypothetical protein
MTSPDFPQTRLALRTWRLDRTSMSVHSLNAPGKRNANWIAKAMASPAGSWPRGDVLTATCSLPRPKPRRGSGEEEPEPHGRVPDPKCSCGVYATTDLDVISIYLTKDSPVLGIVELGGRVIPASNGYRSAFARVAAILLVDEALTEPHRYLRDLADAYRVPALVPHSVDPEDYRELAGLPTVAGEAAEWLRKAGGPA